MRYIVIVLVGLLAYWGYQEKVFDNLRNLYEHRESADEVDRQILIMTAKMSKTFYDFFSGVAFIPDKGIYDCQRPLDLSEEVERITRHCTNHDERVLSIYQWVTTHIEYDYNYSIYTADECYRQRKGVCNAYSDLLVKMLTTADIHAFKVCGKAKKPGEGSDNMHAWVMIEKSDGSFMLADPTWDAGQWDSQKNYHKPTLDWFGCDPKVMIHTHYPTHARHQLLEKPVSEEEYKALPYLEPAKTGIQQRCYYAKKW